MVFNWNEINKYNLNGTFFGSLSLDRKLCTLYTTCGIFNLYMCKQENWHHEHLQSWRHQAFSARSRWPHQEISRLVMKYKIINLGNVQLSQGDYFNILCLHLNLDFGHISYEHQMTEHDRIHVTGLCISPRWIMNKRPMLVSSSMHSCGESLQECVVLWTDEERQRERRGK